jgi:hypothetical protein
VIDLEPHEWRRAGQWFFNPGWPPWDWKPFIFLYWASGCFSVVMVAHFVAALFGFDLR